MRKHIDLFALYCHEITVALRVHLEWPTNSAALFYLQRYIAVADSHNDYTESNEKWHTRTYTIPVVNRFCVTQFIGQISQLLEDEVNGDAKVLKVEVYDPDTRRLIGVGYRDGMTAIKEDVLPLIPGYRE